MAPPMPNPEPNFVMVAPDPATESVERLRRQALRLLTETRSDDPPEPPPLRDSARRDSEPPPSSAPSMIAGVLAMPVVFLAIVFVALAVFGKPGEESAGAAGPEPAPLPPESSAVTAPALPLARAEARGVIALPDDARVESIALDGDRVALHVEGPQGREIILYDYREGRQVAAALIETFSTEATDTLGMLTGPPPTAPVAASAADPAPVEAAPQVPAASIKIGPRLKPRSTP